MLLEVVSVHLAGCRNKRVIFVDDKNIISLKNKKAVPLLFVTAFFCYFASESGLRQAASSSMRTKGFSLDKIVTKLPEGIREKVRKQIELGRLRDQLENASTDAEIIFSSIALGHAVSKEALDKAHAEILEKYPSSPEAFSSYSYFFLAPDTALTSVTMEQYRDFIEKVPEIERFNMWSSAFYKLQEKNIPAKDIFEFYSPLFEKPPKYKDYQILYVDLAELAFQNSMNDLEFKARKCDEECESLSIIDDVIAFEEKQKEEKK